MSGDGIWALVAAIWALALWDMVRRWSFATATRTLKAQFDDLRAEIGDAKLPVRVERLEKVVIALKTHVETTRTARPNPFLKGKVG